MYLFIGRLTTDNLLFAVPHKDKPMKAKHISRKFPEFAKIFDGTCEENTLGHFYELRQGVFEFHDDECEDEVAELMGVKILEEVIIDEEREDVERPVLTEGEINSVREHFADIRTGMAKIDGESK